MATSLCLAAQAQSSVTAFGIVDTALTYGNGGGAAAASKTQITSGGNLLSRIGFRGQEDLGGGMAASFWLEGQIQTDTGNGAATNTNNQASGVVPAGGLNFARRSTVSLTAPWGEVRLGRDVTPQSLNTVLYDPFTNVGVGASLPFVMSLGGFTLLRASNTVAYITPQNLGGFTGQIQHYRGENASGSATSDDGTGTALRIGYEAGAFSGAVAWAKTRYASGDITAMNIGGAYTLGAAKVLFTLNKDTVSGPAPDGKGGLLGLVYKLGGGDIKATYSTYQSNAANTPHASKLALGYVHNLSKRTALYATVAQVRNSGGSALALGGATTSANAASTGVDFGIRHAF